MADLITRSPSPDAGAVKPRTSANFVDLTGKRFQRLVVLGRTPGKFADREVRWTARCDCGNTCVVKGKNLRAGCTTSCGCRLQELFQERREAKRDIAERFWEKVDRSGGPAACWPWLGGSDKHGYGRFRVGSKADGTAKTVLATHMALELSGKPVPPGMEALHDCDNPPCCNPNPGHLVVGTHSKNMADMVSRGRHVGNKKQSRCKLGHEFTPENTRVYSSGRQCKRCAAIRARARTAATPAVPAQRRRAADVGLLMLRRHAKLRTHKPLRARKPMRQRRVRPRRSSRVRDEAYLEHLRALPCCCPTCQGRGHPAPSDPHHPRHERGGGSIGAGRKADDDRAIPLSREHHDLVQHHQGELQRTGPWAGWSTERVQDWHDEQADIHRARYLATHQGETGRTAQVQGQHHRRTDQRKERA